mmetsp:Transcript_7895/g.10684  ORF Transcript_7895/g.10684 Transcript_7895/m.10684 type:complete len:261 (+) Transcript_7895:45-827(+)
MAVVLSQRGTHLVMTKRVQVYDPFALLQIRVPNPPLPVSWGKVIQPYKPVLEEDLKPREHSVYVEEKDMLNADLTRLGKKFMAVLIDPPYLGHFSADCPGARGVTVKDLEKLNLPKICPIGFIFIWVDKALLSDVVYLMEKLNYAYVENLTYVMLLPNNSMHCGDSPYLPLSHRTLLIFRCKVLEGKSIELRHQRSPDVVMDVMVSSEDGKRLKQPEAVYKAIETLLPKGYDGTCNGQFLELWAEKEYTRPGWTTVHQKS